MNPAIMVAYVVSAPTAANDQGAVQRMPKKSNTKCSSSQRIGTAATAADVRLGVEGKAEELLLRCVWPEASRSRELLDEMLRWFARYLEFQAGPNIGQRGGNTGLESEARAYYEQVRKRINRAIEDAASFAAKAPEDGGGIAVAALRSLGGTKPLEPLGELPDVLGLEAGAQAILERFASGRGRTLLVKGAQSLPHHLRPEPFGPREIAAISILVHVPSESELAPPHGAPATYGAIIDAEDRRIRHALKPI